MRKPSNPLTRGSAVAAVVGLLFAALAGVGLAQITTSSSPDPFAAGLASESQKGKPGKKNKKNKKHQQTTTAPTSSTTTSSTSSTSTTTTTPLTTTGKSHKVDVCHKAGSHNAHTINISRSALPAHLAHGDTMGPCTMTGTTGGTTPAATTPAQTTKPKKEKAVKQQKQAKQSKGKSGKSGGHGKGGGKGK